MLELAATHYENLFSEPTVYRPHPFVDSPEVQWDNHEDPIPPITMPELIRTISRVKKKHSTDAHGISTYMLQFIPMSYFKSLLEIYNHSLCTYTSLSYWKHVKMKLIAKKDSICLVKDTRPISLLDIFLKIFERLFLVRFQEVLKNRGILNESQSGFRPNFRLQSRVLNLIDQISSLMNTSAPVATVFVDFKQAFDQLWWAGCLGKLTQLGIPKAYVRWIDGWLRDRQGYIEINGIKSRSFKISRGGPQGSCLTPAIFITFHSDMWSHIQNSLPNFFADDLACVVAGQMGIKYSQQCIDLENRLRKLFTYLEYYTILAVQPINYDKTEILWTARAIGNPRFEITVGERKIAWVKCFRYLGYHITGKLGWGKMLSIYKSKIRQRVAIVKSCTMYGSSSFEFRKCLFTTYILPLFIWLAGIFPLLTDAQKTDLCHFYLTCLKRTIGALEWGDLLFMYLYDERPLEDIYCKYWKKFVAHLKNSVDGYLLFEHQVLNTYRQQWLSKEFPIRGIYRSKRIVPYVPCVERGLHWMTNHCNGKVDSIPTFQRIDLALLANSPLSFMS